MNADYDLTFRMKVPPVKVLELVAAIFFGWPVAILTYVAWTSGLDGLVRAAGVIETSAGIASLIMIALDLVVVPLLYWLRRRVLAASLLLISSIVFGLHVWANTVVYCNEVLGRSWLETGLYIGFIGPIVIAIAHASLKHALAYALIIAGLVAASVFSGVQAYRTASRADRDGLLRVS